MTYVWTDEGWAYVATILDLFSRAVVGWSIDVTATTRLTLAALQSAVQKRRPAAGLSEETRAASLGNSSAKGPAPGRSAFIAIEERRACIGTRTFCASRRKRCLHPT
jgi:transposase InsO family protein